ncbi:MAG TPA: RNA methyltransferase [Planctomycetaceae bacterium]|nr:RNA methyltransferase [Planctomycetaceae bacterium]
MSLMLRNPHSVAAAFELRPGDVLEIRVPPGKPSDAWRPVVELARQHNVPVKTDLGATTVNDRRGGKSERQGTACAIVRDHDGTILEALWSDPAPQPGDLWLALDCLQDPHNVGAVFRTAAFFGIKGIVLTKDRSAPMSSTVYDVASGGVEYVPFVQTANLASALKVAKTAGVWILGSSEHNERDITEIPRDRPWLLVIGNEEQGLRRLSLELCDDVCRITPRGPLGSLNASVAAGVLMATLRAGH